MKGSDFVAVVRLTDGFGKVIAAPGASCERVPESSLGWLERDGLIRRGEATAAPQVRRKPATKEQE